MAREGRAVLAMWGAGRRGPPPAILLTSYLSGAERGRNLGTPGYSYDLVAQTFLPLLEKWAPVTIVRDPERNLDAAVEQKITEGMQPIHVGFLPFQHAVLASSAPNVMVPAWEFPDIPDHAFDDDPRNNWVHMANRCTAVIVGGPFTVDTFRRGGVTAPLDIVPVPVASPCFDIPEWDPEAESNLDIPAFTFPEAVEANGPVRTRRRPVRQAAAAIYRGVKKTYKRFVRPRLPQGMADFLSRAAELAAELPSPALPTYKAQTKLDLHGVVYTSIFNPGDGRKNWEDLLSGFLMALGNRADATLVLKLITSNPHARNLVFEEYQRLELPHRCRVVIITDFLPEARLWELMQASTYYITTTRAEGNCLPVMDYLAGGRPVVTTVHTAISDYFSPEYGFPLESHVEPAAWPQDLRLRCRTTWHRLVWPSLVEQLHASYDVAKNDPQLYRSMSQAGRAYLQKWAGIDSVQQRLYRALEKVLARWQPTQMRRAA